MKLFLNLLFCSLILLLASCTHSKPLVIAHRGASGYLPEHSLSAAAAAHMMNVDFIEQDVVLTKDNVPIVLHDIHLERVTDVESKFPKRKRKDERFYAIDFTLKELKTLELHERTGKDGLPVFKNRFPLQSTGMKIPTLQEEILLIKGMNKSRVKNVGLYVELKQPEFHRENNKDIGEEVLRVLNQNEYSSSKDKVFIQCFEDKALKKLRKKTTIKLIQLIGLNSWKASSVNYNKMMTKEGLKKVSSYSDGIGPFIGYFLEGKAEKYKSLFEISKELGLEVHVYTLRKDQLPKGFKSMKSLVAYFRRLGVSGYFSDQPDLVLDAL